MYRLILENQYDMSRVIMPLTREVLENATDAEKAEWIRILFHTSNINPVYSHPVDRSKYFKEVEEAASRIDTCQHRWVVDSAGNENCRLCGKVQRDAGTEIR